jgi:hypothetical protein
MAAPSEIGAARDVVLDFIQRQNCSLGFAIEHVNRLYATGRLPNGLKHSFEQSWQKPRGCVLTRKTVENWRKAKNQRGHSEPLRRQKDTEIKPWHSLAWLRKQRNPDRKITDIHKQLRKKYPDVSIYQLRRFYAFMRA